MAIERMVAKCSICLKHQRAKQKEPLLHYEVPQRPWQKLDTDIFQLNSNSYLVVVDYYSKYPSELCLLKGNTAGSVITRTLLVALSLTCLEMSFVVKGVILLFRLEYKTSVVCHNVYSYFEKNVHATIPQGNMGYDQYTVPDDFSCRIYFCCFPLALKNTFPWPFVPILSNFFEERRTQNHPQCLSGLSRALFPTTFLEIAV